MIEILLGSPKHPIAQFREEGMAVQPSSAPNGVNGTIENGGKKLRLLRVGIVGCGEIAQVIQVQCSFSLAKGLF